MEKGTIFKFHNDLDTDQIIASQYLLLPNLDEMKGHAFESLDPDFAKKVKPGDFVVGGENFGCGSSCKDLPDDVQTGDTMELHMSDGTAVANGKTYTCTKLPEYMQGILNQGGLIASLNKEEK